jgi:hypothetical protein
MRKRLYLLVEENAQVTPSRGQPFHPSESEKQAMRRSGEQDNSSVNVIYILGAGRSGSTLLNRILDDHPGIMGAGELMHFSDPFMMDSRCSCGLQIPACPFWSEVYHRWKEQIGPDGVNDYQRLQQHFEQYTNPYHKPRFIERIGRFFMGMPRLLKERHNPSADFRRYTEQTQTLFEHVRSASGVKFIVDSSKIPFRAFAFSLMPRINLYVIHLVRDGRGVAWSQRKHLQNEQAGIGWDTQPLPIWKSTESWVRNNLMSNWVRKQLAPTPSIFCRYEDIVLKPAETLDKIGTFIEQDLTSVTENLLASHPLSIGHTLAGNAMRMSPIVTLKHDTAWKENLSPQEIRVFNILAGWLNHRYGYK